MDFDLMAPTDRLRRRAAGTLHPVISLGDPAPFAIAPSPMDKDWRERFDAMYPNVDVLPASLGDKIVGAARDGLRLIGRVGLTSHIADVIRKAGVTARVVKGG